MNTKIGILGGMGPEATAHFFDLLVQLTDAQSDNQHIPLIIYNNPEIPDRTRAIIDDGPSPLPHLLEGARFLEEAGAAFVVMPCITAHYFCPGITERVKIPFLNLLEETAKYVDKEMPQFRRLGLLATTGTIRTGLFQEYFGKSGREIVPPHPDHQPLFMEAVQGKAGVKAGFRKHPRKLFFKLVEHLEQRGAEAVIAGCTEVPLALDPRDITPLPFINPLRIGATACIARAGYRVRSAPPTTAG